MSEQRRSPMRGEHLLDPEVRAIVDIFHGETPFDPASVGSAQFKPRSEAVEQREVWFAGPPGAPDIRGLLYVPTQCAAPRPAIVYMHGGGYVYGSPDLLVADDEKNAETLGAVILSVDYRLAPACKHPGPVEDCYAALKWLFCMADELQIDKRRIAVSGHSAGAGLAAALALLTRDRGEFPIAFQHLIYPMLDDRTAVADGIAPHIGGLVWNQQDNFNGWSALLECAPGSEEVSAYAAAARARDLSGLPATYIACGALDLFLNENIAYAQRLLNAGVPTELHIYPGVPHAFQIIASRVTTQANRDSIEALRKALRG